MGKGYKVTATAVLGAAVFAFWMWAYPQALGYQEQNQLFLFSWDYFRERMALPGGFADWLSEFLVQFCYLRAGGALVYALLSVLLQQAVWRAAGAPGERSLYLLSFVPSLLVLVYQGDVEVLASFPVALLLAVALCPLFKKAGWHRLWLIPLAWWLLGPLSAIPVIVSVFAERDIFLRSSEKCRLRKISLSAVSILWLGVTAFVEYRLLAAQYPPRDAFFGLNYYRLVESLPALQWVIPLVTAAVILVCGLHLQLRSPRLAAAVFAVLLAAGTWGGVRLSYDRDTFEVLAYDWLIRHERYPEVLRRAERYQPRNSVSACSVNFCLFTQGQLLGRLDEFYQCGTEGLVLPSIRDNLSDITSAELLWMMGMPNITLQYSFDLEASIQNGRKSGRFMSRIAECNIVNGWYDRAEKYLDILEKSLFYRRWAQEKKELIRDEAQVAADPVYSYIRQVRFRDDFITNYGALDAMMALLYTQEKGNFMAAEYYTAWQRLKGGEDVQ
ncbi:MAG: hypothetical protein J6Y27_08785 [Bacteroidales bacterium]|nr:hypothetical protein [Bacteroidales bacterium]